MLHVLDGACPELVRTLPALPYDQTRVEDVDTKAPDHHYDALRYLALSIGKAPEMIFDEDSPEGSQELVGLGGLGWRPDDLRTPGDRPEQKTGEDHWAQV